MVASHYGHVEVVKELAQRKAKLNLSTVKITNDNDTRATKLAKFPFTLPN